MGCLPSSPADVLSNVWRMATYALGSLIHEPFTEQDTRLRRTPKARQADPWRYLAANTLLNWAILLQVGLTVAWAALGGYLPGVLPFSLWPRGLIVMCYWRPA